MCFISEAILNGTHFKELVFENITILLHAIRPVYRDLDQKVIN